MQGVLFCLLIFVLYVLSFLMLCHWEIAKRPVSYEVYSPRRIRQRVLVLLKNMKGFVYLLLSKKDHKTYVGSTNDVERRITEHNNGKTPSTRNRRPLKLIYTEEFDTLLEARNREKYLKSRKGRKELKMIFEIMKIGS